MLKSEPNHGFLGRVTLKFEVQPWKVMGHLLCHLKFCASFRTLLLIQAGVTVRENQIGAIFFYLCELYPWLPTLTFCMYITFVNGDNSDRRTDGQKCSKSYFVADKNEYM